MTVVKPILTLGWHITFTFGVLLCKTGEAFSSPPSQNGPSSSACSRATSSQLLPDILAGKADSFAFTGPSADCTSEGCRHGYWGPRCSYDASHPRSSEHLRCPQESRLGLLKMLKDYASNGADWAAEALTMQPCEMWETIKGRTLWFVGDSISQETATSLICFLIDYHSPADSPPITDDPDLQHRLTHNANMKEMTTWCKEMVEGTRICMLRANFGPRMASVMLPALARLTNDEDIVVLNFGLWSNSLDELDLHVQYFGASFKYHRAHLPKRTFWRETSAQHYDTPSGMYNDGAPIHTQRCVPAYPGVNVTIDSSGHLIPMPGMSLPKQWSPEEWELNRMLEGGHRNHATQKVVNELGLHTIATWNTSLAFSGFHHHVHRFDEPNVCAKIDCDCTHACQPSWNQLWFPQFLKAFTNPELWFNSTLSPAPAV